MRPGSKLDFSDSYLLWQYLVWGSVWDIYITLGCLSTVKASSQTLTSILWRHTSEGNRIARLHMCCTLTLALAVFPDLGSYFYHWTDWNHSRLCVAHVKIFLRMADGSSGRLGLLHYPSTLTDNTRRGLVYMVYPLSWQQRTNTTDIDQSSGYRERPYLWLCGHL